MSFQIVSVTNRIPESSYYCWNEFHESLAKFGIRPTILGMGAPWGGLMTKPKTLRKWLRDDLCDADCLIAVDSWDMVFARDPAQLEEEWKAIGRPWIIGGERNLFPAANESDYPKCASSYRFPNSGFIISTPSDMLQVLESMELDSIKDDHTDDGGNAVHENDQLYYQKEFLKQPIQMRIDTETRFVWNLCGVDGSNFDFSGKNIINRETGNAPYAIHFNGPAKTDGMMEPILSFLNLPSNF